MDNSKVELLAPAGSFESLTAALNAGADAVYFGAGKLNMRSRGAVNFSYEEIADVVRFVHERGAKAYLTVNTIIYDSELDELDLLCRYAAAAKVDACIAGDIAAIMKIREHNMSVHMTVQANVTNIESVRFWAQFADVMVLARELDIVSIENISRRIKLENIRGPAGELVKIEVFAHGALCIGISGRCNMSLAAYNCSANRGDCLQNCRRRYIVKDAESGFELEIDNSFVMSPKDICTITYLDRLVAAGIDVLKIEGRARSADYVSTVTREYRRILDDCMNGTFDKDCAAESMESMKSVFNRGFWEGGYYLGMTSDMWSGVSGNISTVTKHYIGKITNYFSRLNVAEAKIETASRICPGDRLLVTGPTSGAVECAPSEIRLDTGCVDEAVQGDIFSFTVPERVRINDKLFLLTERNPADNEKE